MISISKVMAVIVVIVVTFTMSNASAQGYPTGIVSYWKFDEGDGQIASDSIGTNHGWLGSIILSDLNDPSWTTGIVDGALSFKGNNFVEVSDNSNLDLTSSMTLEAWVYPTSYTWANNIITKWGPGPTEQRSYVLDLIYGRPAIWISTDGTHQEGTTVFYVTGSTTLSLNKWYHIVGIFDGNHLKVYVNGILDGYMTWSGTVFNGNAPLRIGNDGWGNYPFSGIIDEVAVYNRDLTLEEIQKHYQNGLKGLGYDGITFADFTIIKAEVKFKNGSNNDMFELKGRFSLGTDSDGIDLVSDDTVVTVNTYTLTIPSGSFLEERIGEFEFEGTINGTEVKLKILAISGNMFEFKVEARGIDLTGTANLVNIKLFVGNDIGESNIRLVGELKLESEKE